jgi:hypothetical protein
MRSEKNCMSAKLLRVSLGVGNGRLHKAIVARNAVVLENAGTRDLYKKRCFSLRFYSLVLKISAPESRERVA